MNFRKTIRQFFIDGIPNGRIACELSNWVGKAYKIPRNLFKKCIDRDDLTSTGVYILFGKPENSLEKPKAYIGEAENIKERLQEHFRKKEFWNEVIVFISKDNDLNKAHVRYLEAKMYQISKQAERYKLENSQEPKPASISEAETAEMEEFLYNLKFLTNALGHKLFEEIESENIGTTVSNSNNVNEIDDTEMIFYINSVKKEANGKGKRTSEGFLVYKEAKISKSLTTSAPKKTKKLRAELLQKGIIEKDEQAIYILKNNYIFNSPSAAASLILGASVSGKREWKNERGETLGEVEGTESEES